MSLKNNIALTQSIGNFFFEKIAVNEQFTTNRIDEWNTKMPVPPLINPSDEKKKFAALHQRLVALENQNSSYGEAWLKDPADEYRETLDELIECFETGSINPINRHIVEADAGFLNRGTGNYEASCENFKSAIRIIDEHISLFDPEDALLPGLMRNKFLYIGHVSLAELLLDEREKALRSVADMQSELRGSQYFQKIVEFENNCSFCPINSWAYFYLCKSSLKGKVSENDFERKQADAVFRLTFSEKHHRNWPIPSLFQILFDTEWKLYYPDFFDEIASIVYSGTADKKLTSILRSLAVLFGRHRLRLPQTLGTVGVAALGIGLFLLEGGSPKVGSTEGLLIFVDEKLNEFRAIFGTGGLEDGQFAASIEELKNEMKGILEIAAGGDVNFGDMMTDPMAFGPAELALASNGNEFVIV